MYHTLLGLSIRGVWGAAGPEMVLPVKGHPSPPTSHLSSSLSPLPPPSHLDLALTLTGKND